MSQRIEELAVQYESKIHTRQPGLSNAIKSMAEASRTMQTSNTEMRGKNKHAFIRSRYMTLSVNKLEHSDEDEVMRTGSGDIGSPQPY